MIYSFNVTDKIEEYWKRISKYSYNDLKQLENKLKKFYDLCSAYVLITDESGMSLKMRLTPPSNIISIWRMKDEELKIFGYGDNDEEEWRKNIYKSARARLRLSLDIYDSELHCFEKEMLDYLIYLTGLNNSDAFEIIKLRSDIQ